MTEHPHHDELHLQAVSDDGAAEHAETARLEQAADAERVERRADLLPEEETAGSEDPEAQAQAILEDSDRRTEDPEGTRHDSTQTLG